MHRDLATLAEILRDNGYGTYAVGKWHLTDTADYGPDGPHDNWPLGRGFARWYGFHGALSDQWNPELWEDNSPIEHTAGSGYHLSEDLVQRALRDIGAHVGGDSGRPFFQYLAFGACHWPHHVPAGYDETLIVVLSDNGASAEGGPTGAISMRKHLVYEKETAAAMAPRIDAIGSAHAYNHYPMGWAQVSNTPLKWYKQDTHGGGVRAPLVLRWGGRLDAGSIRPQFHHVVDIVPTLLGAAGLVAPTQFRGRAQPPMDGMDMAYLLSHRGRDLEPATRRSVQLFEWLGDRGLFLDGWKAVARHSKGVDYADDRWELYHLDSDFSETHDLAATEPGRLDMMVARWWHEAQAADVLPLDDRDMERAAARRARPNGVSLRFTQGMARLDRLSAPELIGRAHEIRAHIAPYKAGEAGVLLAWGSRFGGLVLHIHRGYLVYEYVYSETERQVLTASIPIATGCRAMGVSVVPDPSGGATATMRVDGAHAGAIRLERMWPTYGVTAGITCGYDGACPVSDRYGAPFAYSGQGLVVDVAIE